MRYWPRENRVTGCMCPDPGQVTFGHDRFPYIHTCMACNNYSYRLVLSIIASYKVAHSSVILTFCTFFCYCNILPLAICTLCRYCKVSE